MKLTMNRAILAGSIFGLFTIVILTSILPVYSDHLVDYPVINSDKTILKDVVKANGKNVYWDLTATLDGNLVEWAKNLNGDSHGAGVMIKPDNDHVYTVGVHTYNNCVDFDCGDYLVHGHLSEIIDAKAGEVCATNGYQYESVSGSVSDLGKGHITYKAGQDKTVISLVNIDANKNYLADPKLVCDNSERLNVGEIYLYDTQVITVGETNYLCVHLSDPSELKNSSINGFTQSKTPNLCPSP
jgi:hypothetical protein